MIYLDHEMIIDATKTDAPFSRSATGYGNRIPTDWKIKLDNNRWYRVYAICYSNSASVYIRPKYAGRIFLDVHCHERIDAIMDRKIIEPGE